MQQKKPSEELVFIRLFELPVRFALHRYGSNKSVTRGNRIVILGNFQKKPAAFHGNRSQNDKMRKTNSSESYKTQLIFISGS
jgi:hypothetical protein